MQHRVIVLFLCFLSVSGYSKTREVTFHLSFEDETPLSNSTVEISYGDHKNIYRTNNEGMITLEVWGRNRICFDIMVAKHSSERHQQFDGVRCIEKGRKSADVHITLSYTSEEVVRMQAERLEQFKSDLTQYYEEFETNHPDLDTTNGCVAQGDATEASFPGGMKMMQEYVMNFVRYPEEAMEMEIQGRVYLSIIIEKDGSISEVEVIRAVDPILDREAKRVVQQMPNWLPGLNGENCVARTRVNFPIIFTLQ